MSKSRSPATSALTVERVSHSIEETEQVGERLGQQLAGGDVIALVGELGAGKTTLIRGLAKGLGVDPDVVKSPTFVLLRDYPGRVGLIHIDAYRLDTSASAIFLDVEWMFSPKKVTVIEWANRVTTCLPEDYLEIRMTHKTTSHRTIHVIALGSKSHQVLDQLRNAQTNPQSEIPKPQCHESPGD